MNWTGLGLWSRATRANQSPRATSAFRPHGDFRGATWTGDQVCSSRPKKVDMHRQIGPGIGKRRVHDRPEGGRERSGCCADHSSAAPSMVGLDYELPPLSRKKAGSPAPAHLRLCHARRSLQRRGHAIGRLIVSMCPAGDAAPGPGFSTTGNRGHPELTHPCDNGSVCMRAALQV